MAGTTTIYRDLRGVSLARDECVTVKTDPPKRPGGGVSRFKRKRSPSPLILRIIHQLNSFYDSDQCQTHNSPHTPAPKTPSLFVFRN